MVTVSQLATLNIGQLQSAADAWGGIASTLYRTRDGFGSNIVDPLKNHKWNSDAGDAAAKICENIRLDMEAVAIEVQAVQKFLDDVSTGTGDGFGNLQTHQQDLHQLQTEIIGKGMSLADDGHVTWAEIRAPGPLTPEDQQRINEKNQLAAGFEKRAKAILKAASDIDDSLTRGLEVIFGTEDTFRTEHRWRHTKDGGFGDDVNESKLDGVFAYLKLKGWNDAASLLDHYLNGNGEPVNIDANRLLNDDPTFKQDVNTTLGDIKKLPDGPFTTDWKNSSSPADKNLNWYYALNNFDYRVVGEKHGDQITYHVEVEKRYDWGVPSEHRRDLDKGPVHFEQSDISRLNLVGKGKDFDVHGSTSTMTSP
jgi:hypothetical protein